MKIRFAIFFSILLAITLACGLSAEPTPVVVMPLTVTQVSEAALPTATTLPPAILVSTATSIPASAVPTDEAFAIHIKVFNDGQPIPDMFTCNGDNISPAIFWSKPPAGTKSIALVLDDPGAPGGVFTHWIVYNMSPALMTIKERLPKDPELADVGVQGINDFNQSGYDGPCPPPGSAHSYYFKLYALDLSPDMKSGLNIADFNAAILGHILAQSQWMGVFGR